MHLAFPKSLSMNFSRPDNSFHCKKKRKGIEKCTSPPPPLPNPLVKLKYWDEFLPL